jgi:hypothetical protein
LKIFSRISSQMFLLRIELLCGATFDGGNLHVRFDERRGETERCRMAQATAPPFDSTMNVTTRVPALPRGIVTIVPIAKSKLRDR